MTQKFEREAIALAVTVAVFARSLYPRPFVERRTKMPYENQVIVRLCYVAMGVFSFFVWLGIHSERSIGH